MIPIGGDYVLSQLNTTNLSLQPEPPWIKRCTYGIAFTNDVQFIDDIEFCSEEEIQESSVEESLKSSITTERKNSPSTSMV